MSNDFLAHSENEAGQSHSLKEHLEAVSTLAAGFGIDEFTQKALALAGLFHDLGKYLAEFQIYLKNGGRRGSVRHAVWGARLAKMFRAAAISRAILGHHAGLSDAEDWKAETRLDKDHHQPFIEQLEKLLDTFLADTGLSLEEVRAQIAECYKARPAEYERSKGCQEALTRFVFSALTDADWLDTEAHFDPAKKKLRAVPALNPEEAIAQVEGALAALADKSQAINRLRDQARAAALEKAGRRPGFFSLNLPTGLGKTLTSFRWALEHARVNRLKRVVIVLPYVNIIDQTAERLKSILGPGMVLEHHSGYQPGRGEIENEESRKLAAENWDYPVIVTTSVQFYETLFSHAPWKCRKLHNLAEAVVILDEVQTLRRDLTLPTLSLLVDLQKVLRSSFVLCTATMPDFKKREKFAGLEHITELVDQAEDLFERTRRVEFDFIDNLEPLPLDRLISEVAQSPGSALVILNTRPAARRVFEALKTQSPRDAVYHLSTNMCPGHRKEVIRAVERDLRAGRNILLISTQLVEAGVDFDFPAVFRELAPLESVIQAAGRCNREGRLKEVGRVGLFQLAEAKFPSGSEYRTLTDHLRLQLGLEPGRLNDYGFFADYYRQTMNLYNRSAPIDRESFNFKTISRQYRLIDEETRGVMIWNYNEPSRALWVALEAKSRQGAGLSRDDYRAMQPYCVALSPTVLSRTVGLWAEPVPGLLLWNGDYDHDFGLNYDPRHMPTYEL